MPSIVSIIIITSVPLIQVKLRECRQIMEKMNNAIAKQKNVSMDVKNGLINLEDAIYVIMFMRTS